MYESQDAAPSTHRIRATRLGAATAVAAALVLGSGPGAGAVAPGLGSTGSSGSTFEVAYVNSFTVATGTLLDGVPVGGLSGIDYDARSDEYVAISDNRGEAGPVRYYSLQLPLDDAHRLTTAEFTGRHSLLDTDGRPYAPRTVDTESIRYLPGSDSLLYSSEGSSGAGIPGFVRETARDGRFLRDHPLPDAYTPRPVTDTGPASGIGENLGFEGLTVAGPTITAATENALVQDGPAATDRAGSASRFLRLDRDTGSARGEYVYRTDATVTAPGETFDPATSVQGISEILAVDDSSYLVVERSFTVGSGFTVKVYRTGVDGADNVSGRESLTGAEKPMDKELVFDFATTGVAPECIEGITWGPTRPDGSRTLVLVADDNFGRAGHTTFHLLTVRD